VGEVVVHGVVEVVLVVATSISFIWMIKKFCNTTQCFVFLLI